MKRHTPEWWSGYNCQGPRIRNPYPKDTKQFDQWLTGWTCRFHGEKP